MSYYGVVITSGHFGDTRETSVRFELKRHAEAWTSGTARTLASLGKTVKSAKVFESQYAPEVLAHRVETLH